MATKKAAARKASSPKKAARAAPKKASPKVAPKKAAKRAAPKKAATKTTPAKKAAKKPVAKAPAKKAFGRAGTAGKAEGDTAVRAWIESVDARHRPLVERLDALIGEVVPDVKRAVKWSMPMYGREGKGWFAHVGSFKEFVALGFFNGAELKPQPPFGEGETMRRARFPSLAALDEKQVRSWVEQAASIQGWGKAA